MDDFSPQDLLNIVAAGSSLDERLAKGFLPGGAQTSETTVKARLDAWSQAVARGTGTSSGSAWLGIAWARIWCHVS